MQHYVPSLLAIFFRLVTLSLSFRPSRRSEYLNHLKVLPNGFALPFSYNISIQKVRKDIRILQISMKKEEYWTGAHTKHRLKVHIVFIPKYRKRVLRGEIVQTIKTLFYEACEVNGWYLEKIAVEPDHVHLLLQYKPSKSISEILQIFKG